MFALMPGCGGLIVGYIIVLFRKYQVQEAH